MTPAEQARANAVPCELILYAYRKNKDGIVVSFVVHPDQMPAELAVAPIGSRWVGALVQVGDDELPVPAKESKAKPETSPPARAKLDWREVQPAAQAALRCDKPEFWAFLREEHGYHLVDGPDSAAAAIRHICVVKSRSEFSTDHRKRVLWHQLDSQFQAWREKDRVGT